MRAACGSYILFRDGELLNVPEIEVRQGYYYRPDEARTPEEIRRGTNKTFGRNIAGQDAAKLWLKHWLAEQLYERDWKPPARFHTTLERPYLFDQKPQLAAEYQIPSTGHFSFILGHLSRGSSNLHIQLNAHSAMLWWARRQVSAESEATRISDVTVGRRTMSVVVEIVDMTLAEAIADFRQDPIDFFDRMLRKDQVPRPRHELDLWDYMLTEHIEPIRSQLPEVVWEGPRELLGRPVEWVTAESSVGVIATRMTPPAFYVAYGAELPAQVHFTRDETRAIELLAKAIRHLGVFFTPVWDYLPGGAATLRSLRMDVKPSALIRPLYDADSPHPNLHGHMFVFDAEQHTIGLTCGYVEDEARWLEYQKRHAIDVLRDLGLEMGGPQHVDVTAMDTFERRYEEFEITIGANDDNNDQDKDNQDN